MRCKVGCDFRLNERIASGFCRGDDSLINLRATLRRWLKPGSAIARSDEPEPDDERKQDDNSGDDENHGHEAITLVGDPTNRSLPIPSRPNFSTNFSPDFRPEVAASARSARRVDGRLSRRPSIETEMQRFRYFRVPSVTLTSRVFPSRSSETITLSPGL